MTLRERNKDGIGCGLRGLSLGSQAGGTSDQGCGGRSGKKPPLGVSTPESWGHSQVPACTRLSSQPPRQALTDFLPLPSLAGTDALGHDAPPAAVCSGTAGVTGLSLIQLFT